MSYAAAVESSDTVRGLTLKFFSIKGCYPTWLQLWNPDSLSPSVELVPPKTASALYYASLGGLFYSVQTLLDRGAIVNAKGGYYGNALQAASAEGHKETVKMLLDRGADINAKGGHYSNAL
ncbi:hypothetical protein BFJ66_g990 [Fusarium oxysporum f. sp. cepae]|nr:hypothetical protein BFJ67_g15871 [Fusarium oxysporum f. sp. cepae]RKK62182.1 hypothetical protein BFJ66_g990 [Fusarium oxysporum f. sp. cepae]